MILKSNEMVNIVKHNLKWNSGLKKRSSTTKIILHCTASKEGVDWSLESIHQYHQTLGWSGIGYNFLIYRDGSIHEGRPIDCVGAHAGSSLNPISVGVSYVGGVDVNGKPKDTRTDAQKQAMYELVKMLLDKYKNAEIRCHYEYANKACPSFKRDVFLKEYNDFLSREIPHKCNLK